MKLLIIIEIFDLKRIIFRESKNSIKISYNINFVSMIGITLNIKYDTLIDRGTYVIMKINTEDEKIIHDIDRYFNGLIKNYDKIMINGTIKVKKHNEYSPSLNKKVAITMNSIKKNTYGKNKVQIFSI